MTLGLYFCIYKPEYPTSDKPYINYLSRLLTLHYLALSRMKCGYKTTPVDLKRQKFLFL